MNTIIEQFTQWYQEHEANIASNPMHTAVVHEGKSYFLVLTGEVDWEERARLAKHYLTDYVAELEEAFGEPNV
jgi:hypothetical protein